MAVSMEGRRKASGWRALSQSISIPRIMLCVGFGLAIFLAAGSLTWPLSDDHVHYGFAGDTIMGRGVPYRDAWDLKGPLTYYLYGWVRALLGRNELSIRIFDLAIVSLFCWRLRLFVLELNGHQLFGANFAVLFFLLCYFGSGYYWTAQPDDWGGMLILLAVSFLLENVRRPFFCMSAAGVSMALAILVKPTFVIFVPLMFLPAARSGILAPENLRRVSPGLLVVVFVLTTSYLWVFRNGGFQDLVDALHFASSVYGSLPERLSLQRMHRGLSQLCSLGLVIPYVLVPICLWAMCRSGQMVPARMLAVWFVLSVIMLVYQGVYYDYEYISATIAAAAIIGVSVTNLGRWIKARIGHYLADGAIFALLGIMCLAPSISTTVFGAFGWPGYVLGLRSGGDYTAQISDPADRRHAVEALSSYLSVHTVQSDKVQIWGWVSGLGALTLSRRQAATRFGDTWAVMTDTPLKSYYRRVFLREISNSQPQCVIVDVGSSWAEPVAHFPEFDRFLHRNYALSTHIGDFEIWTWRRSRAR